ncbi:DUF5011 domain-containing protein [Bacteroides thetaiotaomicron]|nr:DUF5011 domain-containing protein [Bacteroides thetaiotaomicron]
MKKYNIQHISMFAVCLWELATNQQMTLLKSPILLRWKERGDEKIVLEKGQHPVEPGYYAEMNGEDIT